MAVGDTVMQTETDWGGNCIRLGMQRWQSVDRFRHDTEGGSGADGRRVHGESRQRQTAAATASDSTGNGGSRWIGSDSTQTAAVVPMAVGDTLRQTETDGGGNCIRLERRRQLRQTRQATVAAGGSDQTRHLRHHS